jgi:glycosyltransferase involved in cell wall biosynthesis
MTRRPVAFVMEQTLGSITHYLNLRREEMAAQGIEPRWLPIEFAPGRFPWALSGSLLARRAIARVADQVDGVFVHSTTLALLSGDLFRRRPAILSTDGTPANKGAMREWYGLEKESRLGARLKRLAYRRAFRAAAGFVAWSQWAKASLVEDYGCPEGDVAVIPPGIDLQQFQPATKNGALPRILFVGGDFARKGGDLLLSVFEKRLRGRAELDLVTSAAVREVPGVRVHRGVSANSPQLHSLSAAAAVFALPTRADCLPLVCMEALAAGLPLVATRVGGIPDLVREGQNGLLVDKDDADALGDALEALVGDEGARRRMGLAAREDARREYDAPHNARRLFEFVRSRLS